MNLCFHLEQARPDLKSDIIRNDRKLVRLLDSC